MGRYCSANARESYDTHVVILDVDETGIRRDPRYIVHIPGKLHPPDGGNAVEANILDISRDGLGFESVLQLNVGETVVIESQSNLAFGIVRHCRQVRGNTAITYHAGLQVYDVLSKTENQREGNHGWLGSILHRRTSGGA